MRSADLGILCICAERYALGRRTYMPGLVCGIIDRVKGELSTSDIGVLLNDIANPLFGDYGDACDKDAWMQLYGKLQQEKERRADADEEPCGVFDV